MTSVQPLTARTVQVRNVSAKAPLSVRCGPVRASSEKSASQPPKREALLSAVIGAAAAIAIGFTATASAVDLAALGAGIDGPARTAQKADKLLKAADKRATDSPERFGAPDDQTGTQAQQAGSGATDETQGTQFLAEGVAGKADDVIAALPSKVAVADAAKAAADATPGFLSDLKTTLEQSIDNVGDAAKDVKSKLPGQ